MGIKIPLTPQVQTGQIGSLVSPDQGTAGLKALGRIGAEAVEIGGKLQEVNAKVERVNAERVVRDHKLRLRNLAAEFKTSLIDDKDPTTWVDRFKQQISGYTQSGQTEALPQEYHGLISSFTEEFLAEESIGLARDSKIAILKQDMLSLQNAQTGYEQNGDFASSREAIMESSLLSEPEKEREILASQERERVYMERVQRENRADLIQSVKNSIAQDPRESLRLLEADAFEGLEPDDNAVMQRYARSAIEARSNEEMDSIEDEIYSNKVLSLEDLRKHEKAANLNPKRMRYLAGVIAEQRDAALESVRSNPVVVQENYARGVEMINGYSPVTDGSEDNAYLAIKEVMRLLPEGSPEKQALAEQLQNRTAAEKGKGGDMESYGSSLISGMSKAGAYGNIPDLEYSDRMNLGAFIDDGFLDDTEKLEKLPFTSSQASTIAGLKEKKTEQIRAFREFWGTEKQDSTASDWDYKVGKAIQSGESRGKVMYERVDPNSELKRIEATKARAIAEAKAGLELRKFIASRKGDVKPEEVERFVTEQRSFAIAEQLQQSEFSGGVQSPTIQVPRDGAAPSPQKRRQRAEAGQTSILVDPPSEDGTTTLYVPSDLSPLQEQAARELLVRLAAAYERSTGKKTEYKIATAKDGAGNSNAITIVAPSGMDPGDIDDQVDFSFGGIGGANLWNAEE